MTTGSDQPDAIRALTDTFVHAPIGLLLGGRADYEQLVRNGRTQVSNARAIGRLVVERHCSRTHDRPQSSQ